MTEQPEEYKVTNLVGLCKDAPVDVGNCGCDARELINMLKLSLDRKIAAACDKLYEAMDDDDESPEYYELLGRKSAFGEVIRYLDEGNTVQANWVKWFDKQSAEDKRTIALAAIERLMELEEVDFRADDSVGIDGAPIPEDQSVDECLYWDRSGEDMRIPF